MDEVKAVTLDIVGVILNIPAEEVGNVCVAFQLGAEYQFVVEWQGDELDADRFLFTIASSGWVGVMSYNHGWLHESRHSQFVTKFKEILGISPLFLPY